MILIAILSSVLLAQAALCLDVQEYIVDTNTRLLTYFSALATLNSSKVTDRLYCTIQCNLNNDCLSNEYNRVTNDCYLYNSIFHPLQKIVSSSADLYMKYCDQVFTINRASCRSKDISLVNIFSTYAFRMNITSAEGTAFNTMCAMEVATKETDTFYYTIDLMLNKVFVFDETWLNNNSMYFNTPAFPLQVNDDLYIAQDFSNIHRMSKNLTMLDSYLGTAQKYRGMYYDKGNYLLYAANSVSNCIDIFYRNLTLKEYITTPTSPPSAYPFSLAVYANRMYVGSSDGGLIWVYRLEDNSLLQTINTPCITSGARIHSLLIDSDGYMAVACDLAKTIYLYHTNGSNMNRVMYTKNEPRDIKVDSMGRFIITSYISIDIYY